MSAPSLSCDAIVIVLRVPFFCYYQHIAHKLDISSKQTSLLFLICLPQKKKKCDLNRLLAIDFQIGPIDKKTLSKRSQTKMKTKTLNRNPIHSRCIWAAVVHMPLSIAYRKCPSFLLCLLLLLLLPAMSYKSEKKTKRKLCIHTLNQCKVFFYHIEWDTACVCAVVFCFSVCLSLSFAQSFSARVYAYGHVNIFAKFCSLEINWTRIVWDAMRCKRVSLKLEYFSLSLS